MIGWPSQRTPVKLPVLRTRAVKKRRSTRRWMRGQRPDQNAALARPRSGDMRPDGSKKAGWRRRRAASRHFPRAWRAPGRSVRAQGGSMRYARIAGTVLLWAIQILAAFAFVKIVFDKFGNAFWINSFARWGYSDGFRILIGVLEMAGGLLLAIPQTTVY